MMEETVSAVVVRDYVLRVRLTDLDILRVVLYGVGTVSVLTAEVMLRVKRMRRIVEIVSSRPVTENSVMMAT